MPRTVCGEPHVLEYSYEAQNEDDTARLGAALAAVLPPGVVVGLCGTLGSGKTRLVQAVAVAAGVDRREVISPTFVLVHQYEATRTIYHVDAYRIGSLDEFLDLGVEEYFDGDGWVLVEWADRVMAAMPQPRIDICIDVLGHQRRRFTVRAVGPEYASVVARLAEQLEQQSG